MMPKDDTLMELDMQELEKAKVGSRKSKIMDAAGVSKDGQPVHAAMDV